MLKSQRKLLQAILGGAALFLVLDQLLFAAPRIQSTSWEFDRGVYLGDFMPCRNCRVDGRRVVLADKSSCYAVLVLPTQMLLYDAQGQRFALYSEFEGSDRWNSIF
ncbi:hypothetical protein EJV47_19920 [Hymenobacter gummosus]|uniref:WG repeat-containing protein n=1 Tax=Hymenobacter gummosus TaxID=1776032 RepID=A0A3S0H757_9BACT|nr:hypothetical protein [Hymenobacter gummosus]RTQ47165.1 hypothetical protein EJV47_19920 [Hymenobacter gummosus]